MEQSASYTLFVGIINDNEADNSTSYHEIS